MKGASFDAVVCGPGTTYGVSACFKPQPMHRSITMKNKRSKTSVDVVPVKASKTRKYTVSGLVAPKVCGTLGFCERPCGRTQDEEDVVTSDSPPIPSVSNRRLQLCFSQRVAPSTLKKTHKPVRRHVLAQKGHQTTLILQPASTAWTSSSQRTKSLRTVGNLCLSTLTVERTESCALPPRIPSQSATMVGGSSTSRTLEKIIRVNSPLLKCVQAKQQNVTGPQSSEVGCGLRDQSFVLSDDVGGKKQSNASDEQTMTGEKEGGAPVPTSHIAQQEHQPALCKGLQRRRSFRNHFIGGRKRYDQQVANNAVKQQVHPSYPPQTTTKVPGVALHDVNPAVVRPLQSNCHTPGSAAEATSTVITASTCASSGCPSHPYHRVPHAYAGDRTPFNVVQPIQKSNETAETAKEEDLAKVSCLCLYNGWVVVPSDRLVLAEKNIACCLTADAAAYGHCWFIYHKQNECRFQPWQMTMQGKIEKLRLGVVAMYWNAATLYPISPATVYVAINNFGRLLSSWSKAELDQPTAARWAMAAVTAFRLAFKAEERPEVMYEISNIWGIFPMFQEWDIDRSIEALNKSELTALTTLGDSLDVPLGPMFLSLYINAAGWPQHVGKDYHELGLYLLALTTFASSKDNFLKNVVPSQLAAAALVLAIKIINGDRACSRGMLHHLDDCVYTSYLATHAEEAGVQAASIHCKCRYEFYPERLRVYTGLAFEDLVPVVKGLSALLRSKPPEKDPLCKFALMPIHCVDVTGEHVTCVVIQTESQQWKT